jgi:glycosyltransferase involved in cell wall biosynthesis
MKALVAVESRLYRDNDEFRVQGPAGYSVWSELLEFFDEVLLVARVRKTNCGPGTERVNGPHVSVRELPDFSGPAEYVIKFRALRKCVRKAVAECDAYILQVPGVVARLVRREIRRNRKPYAVNAMGDPWDALSPGTLRSSLRPIYRFALTREMRTMCSEAQAVLYWSSIIQQRYPAAKGAYATVSDRAQMRALKKQGCFQVGFIGSLEQLYKGPDTLLHAVRACTKARLEIKALLVGEGRCLGEMKSLAQALCVEDKVVFLGQLGFGRPIVDFLDSLDLFVMPSRAEGLPRALVEAMARGCPCLGSAIGGIPELLHPDDLVPPGTAEALAAKILEVAANPKLLAQMSLRNVEKAKHFDPETLRKQRSVFYRHVKMEGGSSMTRNCDCGRA